MRIKLVATIAVLALSSIICIFSMRYVFGVIDEMETLSMMVLENIDSGDESGARETLSRMAEKWEKAGGLLKALTPHEDLHEVSIQYVEATTNLESGDLDDFRRSMALLGEALKHLDEHESLSWSNIF